MFAYLSNTMGDIGDKLTTGIFARSSLVCISDQFELYPTPPLLFLGWQGPVSTNLLVQA
jgi:hypothetical protein